MIADFSATLPLLFWCCPFSDFVPAALYLTLLANKASFEGALKKSEAF